LFADWRYAPDGMPRPEFVLNRPEAPGAQVLLAGDNFGCGSSREHAPWALAGYGFRAIISTSFADIFRNNALKNGLLPVQVDAATYARLLEWIEETPYMEIAIDLAAQTLKFPDGETVKFPIDPFSRTCLLNGIDELGYILRFADQITAHEDECSDHTPWIERTDEGLN
jgi:3-isopropylmalate/(R)-2-methylmalate dehydratase small subunit